VSLARASAGEPVWSHSPPEDFLAVKPGRHSSKITKPAAIGSHIKAIITASLDAHSDMFWRARDAIWIHPRGICAVWKQRQFNIVSRNKACFMLTLARHVKP
jgi:hypothetical protein